MAYFELFLIFQELFSIYSKVNIFFDLYILYIENINDDEMLKRDLENYKRKNDVHTSDLLNINYYNILKNGTSNKKLFETLKP